MDNSIFSGTIYLDKTKSIAITFKIRLANFSELIFFNC